MFEEDRRRAYYDSNGRPINLMGKFHQILNTKNISNSTFHRAVNAEEIWYENIRNSYRNRDEVKLFKGYISHSLDYDWIKPYSCRPHL